MEGAGKAMRNDDLAKRFVAFHISSPETWEAYERLSLQAIAGGHHRLGVGAITEKLRWESATQCPSDNFRAFYARMFSSAHPEHKGFFDRKSSAADYINYEPLLDLVCVREPKMRDMVAEEALGWEDPQLSLELHGG